jgi:hypothetical protein
MEERMKQPITATTWVYVLIQNPGCDEQVVGQHDEQNDISFIPMFLNKDDAMQGSMQMVKEKGQKYEIQAIIYEDLEKFAAAGGFILFVVDDEGRVMEKLVPSPPS